MLHTVNVVPEAVAVAFADRVSVVPEMAEIIVPARILGEFTVCPAARLVAETTVAVGEPDVVVTVVDGISEGPPKIV